LKINGNSRLEMVSARQIKRLPGIKTGVSEKSVRKVRDFAEKHGYCMPVLLSETGGYRTLLSGAATFNACLEEKKAKIPALIVQTGGDADDLMLALQYAQLTELPDAIHVSAAIVQLIDIYGISRKNIAESLGKSSAWINRMEGLARKLNETVKQMVADGRISSRTAQEIARLPPEAQTPFAISVCNEFMSKRNVTYLVNHYLNDDTSPEEKSRIIHSPVQALPNESNTRGRISCDRSESARLSQAMARCLDDATFLLRLLDRIDIKEIAIRISDAMALEENLSALILKMHAFFYPGKNKDSNEGGEKFD